jgi:Acyl-CoA thioesterase C-terminal domain/Acyl-CoA thioesterase N-terminal domain
MKQDILYVREGDQYHPTDRAASPWDSQLIHGGAITGLLAHTLDTRYVHENMKFIRITNDLFRPAPRQPLTVETEIIRDGSRIKAIVARMIIDTHEVARATSVCATTQVIELPAHAALGSPIEFPAHLPVLGFLGPYTESVYDAPPGFNFAVEMRKVEGFEFKGWGTAWLNIRSQVVQDEPNTPVSYMGMMTDFGNGIGQMGLGANQACINSDSSLYLYRYPKQKWIRFKCHSQIQPTGSGTTETELADADGPLGRVIQSLIVRPFSL